MLKTMNSMILFLILGSCEYNSDKETTGRSTPRLQPPKRDQIVGSVINGRSNRFGNDIFVHQNMYSLHQ